MIDEALFRYSADKTGLADFGLESAGKILYYAFEKIKDFYFKCTGVVVRSCNLLFSLEVVKNIDLRCILLPHFNGLRYNVDLNITQSCLGSQMVTFL